MGYIEWNLVAIQSPINSGLKPYEKRNNNRITKYVAFAISDDERTVMLPAVVTSKLVSNLSEATEYAVVLSAVSTLHVFTHFSIFRADNKCFIRQALGVTPTACTEHTDTKRFSESDNILCVIGETTNKHRRNQ